MNEQEKAILRNAKASAAQAQARQLVISERRKEDEASKKAS
jgi:hypothetical protein